MVPKRKALYLCYVFILYGYTFSEPVCSARQAGILSIISGEMPSNRTSRSVNQKLALISTSFNSNAF